MQQQDISNEFEPRGISRKKLVDMAAAIVYWPIRADPQDHSAIVRGWTTENVRAVLIRMLDGDENGDGWRPGSQITSKAPQETEGASEEVGYLVRDTRGRAVGKGKEPCPKCDVSKKIFLVMDKTS